ncbi:MAG: acyl-CoA dehydrogenase [Chloroflexi bacterium]|nr:acyl-CoA dehydrogenase [Chloroflexota bacterium]
MNLDFNESEDILRNMARDFMEKEFPKKLVRELEDDPQGYSPEVWTKMAELGWMGLLIPEKHGGIEGTFMQLVVLLEEMGRACFSGPYFSTILCTMAILDAGSDEQKSRFLPQIAEGKLKMALALTEPIGRFDAGIATKAMPRGGDFVLNGTKLFVQDAQAADYLLCVARTLSSKNPEKGISLFLVDARSPGITITPLTTMSYDHQCEIVFENVRVPKENLLDERDWGWPVMEKLLQKAAIAKCAEMNGGADWVVSASVAYAKDRIQYGKPIGSYQAIQHYLADMWTDAGLAKRITYFAAWKIDQGLPFDMEASIAKTWVSETYKHSSRMGVQIHGALGTTRDHDMGLYYQRARQAAVLFGDPDFHREKVAQQMGL